MATQILMPQIGFSVDEATLVEWLAADGAKIEAGQPLYVLESEKSAEEVEAPASGTLRIIGKTGEVYKVGDLLAELL